MTPAIVLIDGWAWPMDDTVARPIVAGDCASDIAGLLPHIKGRSIIVQAGANVGCYPLALTDHFNAVFTFEPDPVNWDCLTRNLKARDSLHRVVAHHAGLGAEPGVCTPREVHKHNCAAHRVDFGTGDVPVMTIDGLGLEKCDAIWADCEGAELYALQGAKETIARFSPTICVEDKGLETTFYGEPHGSLRAYIEALGYREVAKNGRWDTIFRRDTP